MNSEYPFMSNGLRSMLIEEMNFMKSASGAFAESEDGRKNRGVRHPANFTQGNEDNQEEHYPLFPGAFVILVSFCKDLYLVCGAIPDMQRADHPAGSLITSLKTGRNHSTVSI